MEVIAKNDKSLRELNKTSIAEQQEYVYSLHKEMDEFVKVNKERRDNYTLSDEQMSKLTRFNKCKCRCQEKSNRSLSNNQKLSTQKLSTQNDFSILLSNKQTSNQTDRELPKVWNSKTEAIRSNTPDSGGAISLRPKNTKNKSRTRQHNKTEVSKYHIISNDKLSNKNISIANYAFTAKKITPSKIKANFPDIKT